MRKTAVTLGLISIALFLTAGAAFGQGLTPKEIWDLTVAVNVPNANTAALSTRPAAGIQACRPGLAANDAPMKVAITTASTDWRRGSPAQSARHRSRLQSASASSSPQSRDSACISAQ